MVGILRSGHTTTGLRQLRPGGGLAAIARMMAEGDSRTPVREPCGGHRGVRNRKAGGLGREAPNLLLPCYADDDIRERNG